MISSNPKLGHWNEFQNYHRHLFKIKIKNREFIETDIILFPVWKQCPSWKDQSLDWEIKKISIVYQALQLDIIIFFGVSIFVDFMCTPHQQIYIRNKLFKKEQLFMNQANKT